MAKRPRLPYKLFKRGEIYHAYISFKTQSGERIQLRETTGRTTHEEAERYCIQKINDLQSKAGRLAGGELEDLTLDIAFGRYNLEKGQYQSLPTQISYRLNKLKTDLNVKCLSEVSAPVISSFILKNRRTTPKDTEKLSNATINRYLALLSSVITTAREEWCVKTPNIKISKFKQKEPAENIKFLKDWEAAKKIISNAAPHLKPIIYTALYTGMRLNNILTLKWENLDFTNKIITIRVKDRTTSGGRNHSIPIIDSLEEILRNQPQINCYVFNYRGMPIKSINTAWRNIFYQRETRENDEKSNFKKDKAGNFVLRDSSLPYTNFHTLRHTAATWILKKTGNLKVTKEILGHANINTTLKYAHVLDDERRKALNSVFE